MAGSKSLTVLNKALGRSALSNEFNPLITNTFNVYLATLLNLEDLYSDRVDGSYPGKAHVAAAKALDKFLLALDRASTNTNFLVRLKFLAAAATGEALALKATVRAEAAPAPPAHFTATIAGSGEPTFAFKPFLGSIAASRVGNGVIIIVQDVKISGGGRTIRQRVLTMNFPVQTDGTFTYTVQGPVNNWDLNYVSSLINNGAVSGDAFDATSGTLTVTVNVAAKSVIGSFSFAAPGDTNPGNVAQTSNGSFSLTWL